MNAHLFGSLFLLSIIFSVLTIHKVVLTRRIYLFVGSCCIVLQFGFAYSPNRILPTRTSSRVTDYNMHTTSISSAATAFETSAVVYYEAAQWFAACSHGRDIFLSPRALIQRLVRSIADGRLEGEGVIMVGEAKHFWHIIYKVESLNFECCDTKRGASRAQELTGYSTAK